MYCWFKLNADIILEVTDVEIFYKDDTKTTVVLYTVSYIFYRKVTIG